jgi:hypothetical protein
MGVHAPDIKEEYREIKEFEDLVEGSRFGRCTPQPGEIRPIVRLDRNL